MRTQSSLRPQRSPSRYCLFTAKVPAKVVDPVIREAVNVALAVRDGFASIVNENVPEPAVPVRGAATT